MFIRTINYRFFIQKTKFFKNFFHRPFSRKAISLEYSYFTHEKDMDKYRFLSQLDNGYLKERCTRVHQASH